MDNITGISEFEVRLYDCGSDGTAGVRTLFNFMQSAADNHSKSLGTSVNIMAEKNLTWVYARFYADIFRYPGMYEKVRCETWRSGVTDGMVNREFIMTDSSGDEVLQATSSLALIDRVSRKSVAIPEFITGQFDTHRGRGINYVPFSVDRNQQTDYIYNAVTRYEDIDINGHMNNASYAQLFFESGYSILKGGALLKNIDILFKGEILYNDVINCGSLYIGGNGMRLYHRAFNENCGRVSAESITEWR